MPEQSNLLCWFSWRRIFRWKTGPIPSFGFWTGISPKCVHSDAAPGEPLADHVELIETGIMQRERALAALMDDTDL